MEREPLLATDEGGGLISLQDHTVFARIIRERAGIKLGENKRQLLSGRLRRRMRILGISTYRGYREYLQRNLESEIGEFINALTTNLTSFFRENHHFEQLARVFDGWRGRGPIRVWSAGCSTGEEPYSIAMVYRESRAATRGVPLSLLATDVDTQCLGRAAAGIYALKDVTGLSQKRMFTHFLRGKGSNAGRIRVRDELRRLVEFRRINLLEDWDLQAPLDIIMCRNVVIYFDDDVQRVLFNRFADALKPDGLLMIGHSENLQRVSGRFRNLGQTVYRRVA